MLKKTQVRRSFVSFLFLILFACATMPQGTRVEGIQDLVGQWKGSIPSARRTVDITLTITEDGRFSADGWDLMTGGDVKVTDGAVRWSSVNGQTGTMTLYERESGRELDVNFDTGRMGTFRPAK